jgi:tetratricopeptide (TPR) repeat protein
MKALTENRKSFNLLAFVLILIVGIAAYYNSFNCAFHFDDFPNIVENLRIRNIKNFSSWWSFNPRRPIGFLTFVLNFHFNGLNVRGYHLVNLSIHLINGLLLYWLVKQTFVTPAVKDKYDNKLQMVIPLFTALVFVVHPIMTEAVTYIVQRLVSLATLFYLLSLNLYIKGRLNEGSTYHKLKWFIISVIAATCGLLTKEIAYTIVGAVLLYEFCFFKSTVRFRNNKYLLYVFAFLVVSLLLFFLTVRYEKFFKVVEPTEGNVFSITTISYLFTQFRVLVTYIRLLFVPVNQTFDYDYPLSSGFFEMKTMASFLILLALLILAIWLFRKNIWISFGILWFFLTISVQSSIIARPNLIFEHRLYLSAVGYLFVLIGLFLYFDKLRDMRSVMLAVAVTLVTVYGVMTFQRNKTWLNSYTFWADNVRKSPNKPRPLNNYGKVLMDYGDYQGAMAYFDKALFINPAYESAYSNRGLAKVYLQKYKEAKADLDKAIGLDKLNYSSYNSRGIARYYLEDTTGALEDFNISIILNPNYAQAYNNRANILSDLGAYMAALDDYNKAILLNPSYREAFDNREMLKKKYNIYEFSK